MMGGKKNTQRGFTVAELLVVISVIGILAIIMINSYNGYKARARNAAQVEAAMKWQEVFELYLIKKRAYPPTTTNLHFCLGTGNPTDWDADPDEDCFGRDNIKHPSPALNAELESVVGKLPQYPPNKLYSASINTTVGISLRTNDTLDPATTPRVYYPMLHYWLDGNDVDCGLRPVATPVAGGYVESTSKFTSNDGRLTKCVILLPEASAF